MTDKSGAWAPVVDSEYNRRIKADTSFEITGPARGHEWLKTKADPDGMRALGTFNNFCNGETPWGTYLACEENFNGYSYHLIRHMKHLIHQTLWYRE